MPSSSAQRRGSPVALAAALTLAGLLSACASTPKPATVAGPPQPMTPVAPAGPNVFTALPGLSPAQRGERAQALLLAGQLGPARAEIDALLADAPSDPIGRSLKRQIEEDPRRLLGETAAPHKLLPGETLPELAERYLGDRTLFWALARYNGIPVPNGIKPGDVLQIPRSAAHHGGHAAHEAAEPHPRHAPEAKPSNPAAPLLAPAPAHDPARAAHLRGQGLEALSGGAVDRAVNLLRQAVALDPANPAIQRDLGRAERIQARVHAHR
jgi:hypothetical protein